MSRAQIEDILELPASERVAIVQEIWESVVEESQALPLSAAQRDELERRWLDFQRNPDDGESWDEVKSCFKSNVIPSVSEGPGRVGRQALRHEP